MRCGRRWVQVGSQPLLYACIRDDAVIAPLEVLRIERLNHSPACILAFPGTLRHLVLPALSPWSAQELPVVVAALTQLQVPAVCSLFLRHCLLGRANSDVQRPRSHHARLF